METFKQSMSFLLYATVGYLSWVLAGQLEETRYLWILFALVVIALACWVYGRWTTLDRSPGVRRTGRAASALVLAAGLGLGILALQPPELTWEKWTPARVAELREAQRPVYVDFTARWCATCQVNKGVLATDQVVERMRSGRVALLKADWTNRDPEITRALAELGRSAVPVNLYFAPGADEPVIMPEVLTVGAILDALDRGG
jgi:thiol:disulfide interchange protein DsbD